MRRLTDDDVPSVAITMQEPSNQSASNPAALVAVVPSSAVTCRCDYPQPPDADLIRLAADAMTVRQQQDDHCSPGTTQQHRRSFWKRSTAFVANCSSYLRRHVCCDLGSP